MSVGHLDLLLRRPAMHMLQDRQAGLGITIPARLHQFFCMEFLGIRLALGNRPLCGVIVRQQLLQLPGKHPRSDSESIPLQPGE
jgi:hypothetical protein